MKPSLNLAKAPTPPLAFPSRGELATYLPLVHQVLAHWLGGLAHDGLRDELVAAGTYGLVEALQANPDRSEAFVWSARVRIHRALVEELRAQAWMMQHTGDAAA